MSFACPRCAIALVASTVDWVRCCGRCGGVFAARTVGPMGAKVAAVAESASEAATLRAKTNAIAACPSCKRTMSRETFRGIDVDRCRDHGIWFDRDEVVHVLRGTRPETRKGLGGAAAGAASAATAATILGRPANLSGDDAVDLADVGLEAAVPAIHASVEESDAAAWMVVDLVAALFDKEP